MLDPGDDLFGALKAWLKREYGIVVKVLPVATMNAARITEDPLSWNDRAWVSFRPDAGVVLTR